LIVDLNKSSNNIEVKQNDNIPKVVQHRLDIEDEEVKFKHANIWKSCCLTVDKRAVVFFSQLTISLFICAFTIGMMSYNQDCATFSRFSPLLTLIVGIWLPQPSFKNDK
jgi:hypothetical protein